MSDAQRVREQLIAAGLLVPGRASISLHQADSERPFLAIDDIGRAAAAETIRKSGRAQR